MEGDFELADLLYGKPEKWEPEKMVYPKPTDDTHPMADFAERCLVEQMLNGSVAKNYEPSLAEIIVLDDAEPDEVARLNKRAAVGSAEVHPSGWTILRGPDGRIERGWAKGADSAHAALRLTRTERGWTVTMSSGEEIEYDNSILHENAVEENFA